jgi:hypothetical protein
MMKAPSVIKASRPSPDIEGKTQTNKDSAHDIVENTMGAS